MTPPLKIPSQYHNKTLIIPRNSEFKLLSFHSGITQIIGRYTKKGHVILYRRYKPSKKCRNEISDRWSSAKKFCSDFKNNDLTLINQYDMAYPFDVVLLPPELF